MAIDSIHWTLYLSILQFFKVKRIHVGLLIWIRVLGSWYWMNECIWMYGRFFAAMVLFNHWKKQALIWIKGLNKFHWLSSKSIWILVDFNEDDWSESSNIYHAFKRGGPDMNYEVCVLEEGLLYFPPGGKINVPCNFLTILSSVDVV